MAEKKKVEFENSKELLEEYEKVRKRGHANMFDHNGVVKAAMIMDCPKLAMLSRNDYLKLLIHIAENKTPYHRPQSKKEVIEHLENLAKASRDLNLPSHTTDALWNAIEMLEDVGVRW